MACQCAKLRCAGFMLAIAAMSSLVPQSALAVPALQLYLEGGTYDPVKESWVLTPEGSSGGAPFRLWAIGNVGAVGDINNVRLSAAYDESHIGLQITITAGRAGGDGSFEIGGNIFNDPYAPSNPTVNTAVKTYVDNQIVTVPTDATGLVTNGGRPVLGNNKPLAGHGMYGEGTVWHEFALGDFTEEETPIGDFIDEFPTTYPTMGQVNVYEISVLNGSGATIYFDLYDTIESSNKAKFAPFSHNAETPAETNIIPEPATILSWLGLSVVGSLGLRRRKRTAKS